MSGETTQVDFSARYAIERELGRGTTSTVYLARDTVGGRLVAVKVLRPELAESVGGDRFLREIRLTAGLHHPNIVPLLDSGERDGSLAYVLPYMDGGTLRARMDREKQLPIDQSIAIARTLALALDYAHARGLVHRDVKPENVLFTADQACLADFGIARALEGGTGETTSTGIVRGTPAYMSPEQVAGDRSLDGRSDIYSLACVLYEMITGMAPFVGPTAQSVMAQRVTLAPRPASAYRTTVSPALDMVLSRAMAAAPADRYQTAAEFANALAAASDANAIAVNDGRTGPRRRPVVSMRGAMLATFVIVATLVGVLIRSRTSTGMAVVGLDTTRVVVMPFEGAAGKGMRESHIALAEAFARWRGLTVADPFELGDALARARGRGAADLLETTRHLRAGRFVRTSIDPVGDSLSVHATIFDASTGRSLHAISLRVHTMSDLMDSVFNRMADSLLLRGAAIDSRANRRPGPRSLPALQRFVRAMNALQGWDLSSADSALQSVIVFDPTFTRGYFWLAQVRVWERQPPDQVIEFVRRAVADSLDLTPRESQLAHALNLLAAGDYVAACRAYEALRSADDRDPVAWLGLGDCRRLDNVVLRDASTRSGWRFRSSYQQALIAYTHAFELMPLVHRGFEQRGFAALQELLYTQPGRLRTGVAASPDSGRFYAGPDWQGDTLLFVPFSQRDVVEDRPDARPVNRDAALAHQRKLFLRIATLWASALARSAGAKAALGLALDMLGDRTSADTLHLAASLTEDSAYRLELVGMELLIRFKYALPDRAGELEQARRTADSLIAANDQLTGRGAAILAVAASIVGRCGAAERFARAAVTPSITLTPVPQDLNGEARALVIATATGCAVTNFSSSANQIAARIAGLPDLAAQATSFDYALLGQSARLQEPADSAWIRRLAASSGDVVLRAREAVLLGRRAQARALVQADERGANSSRRPSTADASLAKARVLLAIGDSAAARDLLDRVNTDASSYSPSLMIDNLAIAGSLIRCVELRGRLAHAAGDSAMAHRYARAIAMLREDSAETRSTSKPAALRSP